MDILRDTTRTARKIHICDYCGFEIAKGTAYNSQTNVNEGIVYTWKSHFDCRSLARKLRMFDTCWEGEGLDSDMFKEIITDYLDGENIKYNNWREAYEQAKFLLLGVGDSHV